MGASFLLVVASCWIHESGVGLSTEDWSLNSNGTTQAQISSNMHEWLTGSYIPSFNYGRQAYPLYQGPKSPGLIILEHELTDDTAQAFINNYYLMPSNNWRTVSAAKMDGLNKPYQNAKGTTGSVTYSHVVPKVNNAVRNVKPRRSNNTNGVGRTSIGAMLALCMAVLTCVAAWLC